MAQSKINKHGYEMKNLREICSMTKGLGKTSYHIEIAWEEGKILYEEHIGTPGNQWVQWKEGVIPCGYLTQPMSQQQIADKIEERISSNTPLT